MSEAVADSTVLIFLGKLRRLNYLQNEYSTIIIPPAIHDKVVTRGLDRGERDAVLVEQAIDDGWIQVQTPETTRSIERYALEHGETAVLALAMERDHKEVLIDEESAREGARLLGLNPHGTLFFLFSAVKNNNLDFNEFMESLERLLEVGLYLDESLYLEAIRIARKLSNSDLR